MKKTMIQSVKYCGLFIAEDLVPKDDQAIISITEFETSPVKLSKLWKYRLNLFFHDIDLSALGDQEEVLKRNNFSELSESLPGINEKIKEEIIKKYTCFNKKHVDELNGFLNEVEDKVTTIIVHCHAGISRSAAIAKHIAEVYDLPFNHQYPLYNKYVYRQLWNERFKNANYFQDSELIDY